MKFHKKPVRFFGVFVLIFTMSVLAVSPVGAASSEFTINSVTVASFPETYQSIETQIKEIESSNSAYFLKQIRKSKGKYSKRLTKKQSDIATKYKSLLAKQDVLKPMEDLRLALNELYRNKHKNESFDEQKLNAESTFLAVKLVQHIDVLKEKYRSIFIPIVHNMMIDIGVRKRGACKHWAEDLLDFMRPMHRDYFVVTWGEANPEKFTEHNVAVVIPKGGTFDDGMLIDPWRTSGKPFWIGVTKDSHYHWQKWSEYGIY